MKGKKEEKKERRNKEKERKKRRILQSYLQKQEKTSRDMGK